MKRTILFALILCTLQGTAQIRLVGIGTSAGGIDILQWEALDSTTVSTTPSLLWACLLGSSAFDAFSSNYYLTGYAADTSGLYSYNTETGSQSLTGYTNFSNITEFDMSTGKIYNLRSSDGNIEICEYNLSTGHDSLIGSVPEPGIQGIAVDAIGFDSNNGILYYIGNDGTNTDCLFGFHVRAAPFTHTKIPIVTMAQNSNIYGLNFDNVTGQLFANQAVFDGSFNYIHNRIVEVNLATGEVIPRGVLDGFIGFVVGSSCYDQFTGSYLVAGVDSTYTTRMIVFNTTDNTYVTGFVPDNAGEIVCDNHSFSTAFYLTSVGSKADITGLKVYPNPAGAAMDVVVEGNWPGELQLKDMNGRTVLKSAIEAGGVQTLNVADFPRGGYLLVYRGEKGDSTLKVILR